MRLLIFAGGVSLLEYRQSVKICPEECLGSIWMQQAQFLLSFPRQLLHRSVLRCWLRIEAGFLHGAGFHLPLDFLELHDDRHSSKVR